MLRAYFSDATARVLATIADTAETAAATSARLFKDIAGNTDAASCARDADPAQLLSAPSAAEMDQMSCTEFDNAI
jgi:hypothetical protein